MSHKSLADLAAKMRGIDIAMLSTKTDNGQVASRPMSNNADVDYNGDSYYFTFEKARSVSDIARDPKVSLAFVGKAGMLAWKNDLYVAVEGEAELIRDRSAFEKHWIPSLNAWFDKGIDTPGIVLVKVHAERIKYWDGMDHGEFKF